MLLVITRAAYMAPWKTSRVTSPQHPSFRANRFLQLILAAYAVVWCATAIAPRDWPTWLLENLLVVITVGGLALTYRRFAFSNVSYLLIALFLVLHAIGAHSGYMHTPIGDWLRDAFGLRRNPYDRVIHCAFGLLLAYPLRELLMRTGEVRGWAANWLPVGLVLAVSTCFEVIESAVAEIVSPGTGPAWLGAQGDDWDAQLDMAAALLGASAAMVIAWWRESVPPRARDFAMKPFCDRRLLHALCICYAVIWIIAAINPLKRDDWLIENLLVFAAVPALVFTWRRLPLSDTAYTLIFLFLVLHAAGAHYTYSEVPLGYWLKETFHLPRNHFDRIVHLSFGLLLTYPMCEILGRTVKARGAWALLLPAAVIVSLSGFFEIIEGIVAWFVSPELGQAYLGTQGDVWDAQKDMALAIFGAAFVVAMIWLSARRKSVRHFV